MYICICHAIRESDVRAAVDGGLGRAADYFRCAGLRPQCGRCVRDVQGTIDKSLLQPAD